MPKPKNVIIGSSIDTCFVCKKSFNILRMVTPPNEQGLSELILRTAHVSCRKHNEKMEKLTNEIEKSVSVGKFHQGYIKDLKQQKLQAEYDFFINC